MGDDRHVSELSTRGRRASIGAFVPARLIEDAVRRVRPRVLAGPPSALAELAERLGSYPAEAVLTAGEPLDAEIRDSLRTAYGVQPFDLYMDSESGPIAWECRTRSGYHVHADAVVVEVVDDEGDRVPDGTTGEVVLTALINRTTPLVRYRTGDLASLLARGCSCGILLPLMSQVEGRANDWVIAADGRRVSPFRFMLGLLGTEWGEGVRRYHIVQRAIGDFLVEVVWRDGRRDDLVERVRQRYAWTLGESVRVEVRETPELTRPRRGKRKVVESWVAAGTVEPRAP